MSCTQKKCEANGYSQCYADGPERDVEVIFKYRYKKGGIMPDEIVKVSLCGTHAKWLNDYHAGNPLEMRGEDIDDAMYNDLFQPFANEHTMYTLVKMEMYDGHLQNDKFFLINGRNVDKFRTLLEKHDLINNNAWIGEVGFFQTCTYSVKNDDGNYEYIKAVVEVIHINGELSLEAMANGLLTFYKRVPEGEVRKISETAMVWEPRIEPNPTLDTEYTLEPIQEFVRAHFAKKQEGEKYGYFEDCCEFIEDEIDINIVDWREIREKSKYAEKGLYITVSNLTDALINNYNYVVDWLAEGDLTEDVLFVTYIMANHRLFASDDVNKRLYNNVQLIELFVAQGLEKNLLALAIAGERTRLLSRKQRDHYNILNTNEFVVKYLMPKYINGSDIIYDSDHAKLTSLEYWHYYDNTTSYFGGGFCGCSNNIEIFEKNQVIHDYLLKYTPTDIIYKINNPAAVAQEPVIVEQESVIVEETSLIQEPVAQEPVAPEKPQFGSLDVTLLSGDALECYNKVVRVNGHPEAEFIILGFPHLFEHIYTSAVTYKRGTMEDTEKIFPGITEFYEQKKRDLRNNDYDAWKFVNDKLRKNL